MLAIDTNLIVRHLVGDDHDQALKARLLIDNDDIFVCTMVVLETEWVLRRLYGLSPDECAKVLAAFAGLPRVTIEDAASVGRALEWTRHGMDLPIACIWQQRKAVTPS